MPTQCLADLLYVYGGYDLAEVLGDLLVYSFKLNSWRTINGHSNRSTILWCKHLLIKTDQATGLMNSAYLIFYLSLLARRYLEKSQYSVKVFLEANDFVRNFRNHRWGLPKDLVSSLDQTFPSFTTNSNHLSGTNSS